MGCSECQKRASARRLKNLYKRIKQKEEEEQKEEFVTKRNPVKKDNTQNNGSSDTNT